MANSPTSSKWSAGCLALFGLPFAAIGVGATIWCAYVVLQHAAMRLWVEVPATIKSATFKEINNGDGSTYKTLAEYEYEFGGKKYTSDQVGLGFGSDNIGHFQRDAYNELKRHLDQHKPFRCYVNAGRPAEAVLYRKLRGEMVTFFTMFGTLFGSVGLGLIVAGLAGARRTPMWNVTGVPKDEPWLARSDWAAGQILADGGATVPVLIALAIYWHIAQLPLLFSLREIFRPGHDYWAWGSLVFPLIGAILLATLAYNAIRSRKFGESTLQLASTPGVIGGQLAGVVRIAKSVQTTEGFHLILSCLERQSRGEDSYEASLWQDERVQIEAMQDGISETTAVPVLFAIPFDCEETTRPGANRDIKWRLAVSAKTGGIDFKSSFELPVFKTPDSRADFALDKSLSADYAAPPTNDYLLAEGGIFKEPIAGGGVRLVFPAARNWGNAIGLTLFLAFWTVALVVMRRMGAPLIFPIVFGLFELAIIWSVLDLWFYRSVVEATSSELITRGGLLGIGRRRILAAEDVKQFSSKEYMSSGANVWKSIVVVPRTGRKRTIAKGIRSKLALDAVIDELKTALGLQR